MSPASGRFFALNLAWLQLWHRKGRLAVALAGVAFAVVLILMQLGFRESMFVSASRYQERLDYDLALFSPESAYIVDPRPFSRRRLYQALGVEGVASVSPIWIQQGTLKNPHSFEGRSIWVVGIDPTDEIFEAPGTLGDVGVLKREDHVLYDDQARPEFGPIAASFRGGEAVSVEVNHRRVHVGGLFSMGTSFGIDGTLVTSEDSFRRIFPQRTRDTIHLGLIRLRPEAPLEDVRAALRRLLPPDVLILTKPEFMTRERDFWGSATPIGYVFAFGAVIGFLVGSIIVYQILFADISDHLAEYATLKAMGYSNGYLSLVVTLQATLLGVLGYVPGFAICSWLYGMAAEATRLPMAMSPERAVGVLLLAVGMCCIAAVSALRVVHRAHPAEVF